MKRIDISGVTFDDTSSPSRKVERKILAKSESLNKSSICDEEEQLQLTFNYDRQCQCLAVYHDFYFE